MGPENMTGWLERFDFPTRIRLRALGLATADYAVSVSVLAAYAAIGTVPWWLAGLGALLAAVVNSAFLVLIVGGFSKPWADPALTGAQIVVGCLINLGMLHLAPQIAHFFILTLFVTLSFGSLHFDRRQFFKAWALLSLGVIPVVALNVGRIGISDETLAERILLVLVLALGFARFLGINAEVSRLRQRLHEKNKQLLAATGTLAELATRDELTGIFNRREFMRLLGEECQRAERTGLAFGVAMIDADHFKTVNDRHGHAVGDTVLKDIVRLLGEELRAQDRLGRYGGEEFALVLLAANRTAVGAVLERMRQSVEGHDWSALTPDLAVTISLGATLWRPGDTVQTLLNEADKALYVAKRGGRNRVAMGKGETSPSWEGLDELKATTSDNS